MATEDTNIYGAFADLIPGDKKKTSTVIPTAYAQEKTDNVDLGSFADLVPKKMATPAKESPSVISKVGKAIDNLTARPEGEDATSFWKQLPSSILEHLHFGVGDIIKTIRDDPESAAKLTVKDLISGSTIKETAKNVTKGFLINPLLTVVGGIAQFSGAREIKFDIPGLGEVSNAQYRAAEAIRQGESTSQAILNEAPNAIFDSLFVLGLGSKLVSPRPVTILKGEAPPGVKSVESPKSFRLYEEPKVNQPLTPEFVSRIATEKGIDLGSKYDPNLPTFFRIERTNAGTVTGELVQLKPSYLDVFLNKLKSDVSKVPENQLSKLYSQETSIQNIENAKPIVKASTPPAPIVVDGFEIQKVLQPVVAVPRETITSFAQDIMIEEGVPPELYETARQDWEENYAERIFELSSESSKLGEQIKKAKKAEQSALQKKKGEIDAQEASLENEFLKKYEQEIKANNKENLPEQKQNLGEAPAKTLFRGGGEGSAIQGTAADIIKYEREELGNIDVVPVEGIDLGKISAKKTVWLTENEKSAEHYGKVESKQYAKGSYRIIARDGNGGVLVESIGESKKPSAIIPKKSKEEIQKTTDEIDSKEESLVEEYSKKPKEELERVFSEILTELELSEAGRRIFSDQAGGFAGVQSSTFPKWIPDELRSKKLFAKVMGQFNAETLSFPEGNRSKQRALYNALLDEVDLRLGINTSEIRSNIVKLYDELGQKEEASKNGSGSSKRGEITTEEISRKAFGNEEKIKWCIDKHRETNHFYDKYLPYEFHLRMVAQVAVDFIHVLTGKEKFAHVEIQLACYGHDLIEDCRCSYNDVRENLGAIAADIVYAVTNEKGRNRAERGNERYYDGIKNTPGATFVKLCDRIANVQYSKLTKSKMFEMYKKENKQFVQRLMNVHYILMFDYLDSLFAN